MKSLQTEKTNSQVDPAKRIATVTRQTNETDITLTLCLDGSGQHDIQSGIGFLDHMLSHVAVHGLIDLTLKASGDLHVDVHHTVEDIAITLGQAVDQALDDRSGIFRIASATVPMDETLVQVTLDLSGRSYSVIQAVWNSSQVGGIPVTLFPHFLESFASAARANLHAQVFYGRDDHHKSEALFKALGRALDSATQIDDRRLGMVPSTKGSLTK